MIELIPLFADRSHHLVNEEMRQAMACPKCNAFCNELTPMTENRTRNPRYLVTCDKCEFQGPFGQGLADAVERWNKPPTFWCNLMNRIHTPPIYPLHKPVQRSGAWTS